jgi:hypothetical protein
VPRHHRQLVPDFDSSDDEIHSHHHRYHKKQLPDLDSSDDEIHSHHHRHHKKQLPDIDSFDDEINRHHHRHHRQPVPDIDSFDDEIDRHHHRHHRERLPGLDSSDDDEIHRHHRQRLPEIDPSDDEVHGDHRRRHRHSSASGGRRGLSSSSSDADLRSKPTALRHTLGISAKKDPSSDLDLSFEEEARKKRLHWRDSGEDGRRKKPVYAPVNLSDDSGAGFLSGEPPLSRQDSDADSACRTASSPGLGDAPAAPGRVVEEEEEETVGRSMGDETFSDSGGDAA